MDGNPKQLIVERIKSATNILVTVGRNPSVDALAAALGFTMMLNKMDKHATAVVSGAIPDAISFLEPNKTFENTVDSLRDFIIALDKEKADRLRYKVEDDVVRIFITPYRTTITQDDLDFSQGDFNVELIVALGVDKKDDLDAAITAHGRILHDATVVTINPKNGDSSLGSLNWNDAGASSLCEMLMSLSEALQSGLLDEQIASSLLTGIVAATERFSNPHTTPKVMTMAAQLMAAGANQQLIAAKLEEGHALAPQKTVQSDGTVSLEEGSSTKVQEAASAEVPPQAAGNNGEMQIEHTAPAEPLSATIAESTQEAELAASISPAAAPTLSVSDLQKDLEQATNEIDAAAGTKQANTPAEADADLAIEDVKGSDWRNKIIEPPVLGGTLSATSSEAEEEKLAEERSTRNHTILSHDSPVTDDQATDALVANDAEPHIDPFTPQFEETPLSQQHEKVIQPPTLGSAAPEEPPVFVPPAPALEQPHIQTIAELEAAAHQQAAPVDAAATSLDSARAAVDAALGTNTLPPLEAASPQNADTIAPPPPPPMPDFSSLPPLPPLPGEPQAPPANPQFPQPPADPGTASPGQFRIPGQ